MDSKQVLRQLEADGVEHLWVLFHDYGGRTLGKAVPSSRFEPAIERGVTIPLANLDYTFLEHYNLDPIFTAETGDFLAQADPASYAPIPYREGAARMFAFMRADNGSEWEGCPRTQLRRMVDLYAREGLSVQVGYEAEFMLLVKEGRGEYRPVDEDRYYSATGFDRYYAFWRELTDSLQEMGLVVVQYGRDDGHGQYEMTTRHAAPLQAADDYLTLKEVVRALSRERGWVATFMPKPYADMLGNGLHTHLSLWDADGKSDVSMGERDDEPLSPVGRHFVAGLLAHAAGLAGIGAPIVNSYKRLLPGSWAPAHVCWGVRNRAALVRVPSMGRRRRIEFRSGDNAANPYLLLTAIMAAGLDGIRNQTELPDPVEDDVGFLSDKEAAARGLALLPRTLPSALEALEADQVIAEALGPTIFHRFLNVKRAELHDYNLHVHRWERETYLEDV